MSRIYERRKSLKLSQAAVARISDVAQSTISDYELGRSEVGSSALVGLARALECSADYLLELTDDPTPHHVPAGLSETEQRVIAALRADDRLGAIRLIVGE